MLASLEMLQAALPNVLAAPKDNAEVEMLCVRPRYGQRKFVDQITCTAKKGIVGERWLTAPWLKLSNGAPDPRIQVSILSKRVLDEVWLDRDNVVHPGDTFIVDMDLSEANIPTGTVLQVGTVLLRVSDEFNDGCVKWKARYGAPAKAWIIQPENVKLRLRGMLCEIVKDGVIKSSDRVLKTDT